MSRGVHSSAGGSGAGTKAEYEPSETLRPGILASSVMLPFSARKQGDALFSIFIIIENNGAGNLRERKRRKQLRAEIDAAATSHGHGPLPQIGNPVHQLGQVASPVQQRVLRMQMQMRKFSHRTMILVAGLPFAPCPKLS